MPAVYTADQIKKMISDQQNANRRDAQKEIDAAFIEFTHDSINSIPESVFVQSFLPFFAGRLKPNEAKIAMADWIAVAGAPSKPVAVISDTDSKRLFVVPPMVTTVTVNPERRLSDLNAGYGEIINNYVMNKHTSPRAAEAILNRDLLRKNAATSSGAAAGEVEEKVARIWKSIFARYDIADKQETSKPKQLGDAGEEMIFEDA